MATVKVTQPHSLPSPADARARLGGFEDMLRKYGVKLDWRGDHATFNGIGVSGGVDVTSRAVDVTVKLGLMAKAAGVDPDRLRKSIEKRLAAALTGEGDTGRGE
jgi:putative polyhydroxyalkanoate system protein